MWYFSGLHYAAVVWLCVCQFDDPMPHVVDAYFTAGHVIFAGAACLLSLVTLVILDTVYRAASSSNPL